ncbi:MAG: BatD family protein [Solidesulfovibrio sp.]|uniref:BatD family protein n=1 Tax=Solidesulfovibrio sp. TaxID=2910990 RepID=UPI003158E79E
MRRLLRRLLPCLPALVLAAVAAWAQGPAVTAEIDAREAVVGQGLTLRVTIPGREAAVIDIPELADWTVIARGRVVGARGGDGQAVSAYRFELIPRREGELTFPPLAVETGGARLATQPVGVRVHPRPSPPKGLAGRDLFLDATVSEASPYVGQTVVYTATLYRAVAASAVSLAPPAFPGFAAQPLPGQRDGELRLGGKAYAIAAVDYLLTPLRAGRESLAAPTARLRGLSGTTGETVVAGPGRELAVRELPAYAGPAPFTGLVGRMELASRLAVDAGEGGAVYELVLSGRGNLDAARPPALDAPAGLTVRGLAGQGEVTATPSGYAGSRVFRYAVTAVAAGAYTLPAVRLAVFDPEAAAYRLLEAPPRTYVAPPPAALAVPALHGAGEGAPAGPPALGWRMVWALFPPAAYGLTFWPRRRRAAGAAGEPDAVRAAEALRQVLARPASLGPEEGARAAAVLARLDRLLYAGGPAAPGELEEARREALALVRGIAS